MSNNEKKLYLQFHGRIIDSLGIQMYQSPVAAIAELIANAWDADSKTVDVKLPDGLDGSAIIEVRDDGAGMTFQQCQDFYLKVGRNRRVDQGGNKSAGGRPLLGKKGIGKFAGFGICELLEVDTISRETGERTTFQLDIVALRGEEYINTEKKEIQVTFQQDADQERKNEHGTKVTLRKLTLQRTPSQSKFSESMARRFLIHQTADKFAVKINNQLLSKGNALSGVEFDFPKDYTQDQRPEGLIIEDGFGIESIGRDQIKWRIRFTKKPIDIEELRGVSVFCGIKVAQTPFFFNLYGGLDGQHGQQYISGQVVANYLDSLAVDTITTERQRINWELSECQPLEKWGQERIKALLAIWKKKRVEKKVELITSKIEEFDSRLNRLSSTERKTVEKAIRNLATVEVLSDAQFRSISNAILTAWEMGRLHELIQEVSAVGNMGESELLSLLAEAQVLSALHVAEAVKSKLEIIRGLQNRVQKKELENAVKHYIADNPWLLSPEWETFRVEKSVKTLVVDSCKEAGLDSDESWQKRVDLILSSGTEILVVEFMRPGLTVDRDHIDRFQFYIDILRSKITGNTGLRFKDVSGLLIADKLNQKPGMKEALKRMADDNMKALEWVVLFELASKQWAEFRDALVDRAPNDERLSKL